MSSKAHSNPASDIFQLFQTLPNSQQPLCLPLPSPFPRPLSTLFWTFVLEMAPIPVMRNNNFTLFSAFPSVDASQDQRALSLPSNTTASAVLGPGTASPSLTEWSTPSRVLVVDAHAKLPLRLPTTVVASASVRAMDASLRPIQSWLQTHTTNAAKSISLPRHEQPRWASLTTRKLFGLAASVTLRKTTLTDLFPATVSETSTSLH